MLQRSRKYVLAAVVALAAAGLHSVPVDAGEVVFEESFSVEDGGELTITVGDMDVKIEPGKSNEATVAVTVTGNVDKMRERFEKMNFTAELEGNSLVIDTDERGWTMHWWGSGSRGSILLTVHIPERFDVHAQTSDGDIDAGPLQGDIVLKSSDGDIETSRLSGSRAHLVTSDGDVRVDDITSDDIVIRTSDGDVTAERLQGESVELKTSDGDIGAAKIEAEKISARSSDGDLDLTVSGGELVARTSDGDITVTVDGQIALDLTTGDGDVVLRAPRGFGAVLDLRGEHVKLGGNVSLDGEVSTRRVSGKLGDGGPQVRVRTSDGSIAVRFD